LVAYSLGGLLARAFPIIPSFINSSNYGQGYVHKLITLDTPHRGSEFARQLLLSNSFCQGAFQTLVGPVGQNIVDLAPGSVVLTTLGVAASGSLGPHLPTAVIASIASSNQEDDAYAAYLASNVLRKVCPTLLPSGGFEALFGSATNPTGSSDLIVSLYSQQA